MQTTVTPSQIRPWHEIRDETKLADLIESMQANGWLGAPIVVIDGHIAITGSHRLAAAEFVGLDVPTVDLDELLAAHGTSLADLDEEYGTLPGDELHYEVVTRLDYHLPADVVDHYGLDAH